MSDRERELFSERYEQSVYDCDPYPSLLVQAKLSLEQAKRGENIPSWSTQEACIMQSEEAVAFYEKKIAAGILTYVQDLETQRFVAEQAEQEKQREIEEMATEDEEYYQRLDQEGRANGS